MKNRKTLYCIVGPSGSGKTTLVNALQRDFGLHAVSSYTDRKKRGADDDGHIFVTPEEFNRLGELAAYTEFCGHRYGVTVDQLTDADLYVIDVEGVEYLKAHMPEDFPICVIGLKVSECTAMLRMLQRGDTVEDAYRRIVHDAEKFAEMDKICDIMIDVNDVTPEQAEFQMVKVFFAKPSPPAHFCSKTNTVLEYQYRDADNYKNHGSVVLGGMMTEEQFAELQSYCDGYCFFNTNKVGFPDMHFEETTEADHDFHEIVGYHHTTGKAGSLSVQECLELFRKNAKHWLDF